MYNNFITTQDITEEKYFTNSSLVYYNKTTWYRIFCKIFPWNVLQLVLWQVSSGSKSWRLSCRKNIFARVCFFYRSCKTVLNAVSLAYAGLEHRAAFLPRAGAAAGMRVTEVRKAGWHIKCRPERADIRYDEYGQRVYIKYGNGVETNYTYDADMRWLAHINTQNKYGTQYQNIN